MGFRGHLVSGLALGVLAAELGVRSGRIPASDPVAQMGLGAVAALAALLPDLDTSSVPQRWFFRALVVALLYLAFRGRFQLATGLAVISLLPLLDHHRGWTHGRYTPLLVLPTLALALAFLGTYGVNVVLPLSPRPAGASWLERLIESMPYILAAGGGWYLHLLLDGKLGPASGSGHR